LEEFLSIDDDDNNNINTTTLDTQSEHVSSSSKPKLRSRERRIGGKKPSRSSGNQSVASAPTAADDKSKTKKPPRSRSHGPSRHRASLSKPAMPSRSEKHIGIETVTTPTDHETTVIINKNDEEQKDGKERLTNSSTTN
jgi:hypothetical protein